MAATKSKHDILRRSKEREKKIRKIKIIFGLVLIFILVASFLALLNWSFFRFQKIVVVGDTAEDRGQIQNYVLEELTGRYFWLVPKDSVFFLHKQILAGRIKREFPRLAEVEVNLPELNTLKIATSDKKAVMIWCRGQGGVKSGDCYYLNEDGEIYSESPIFSEAIMTEIIGPLPESPIGQVVIASSTITKIQTLTLSVKRFLADLPGGDALELLYWQPLSSGDWAGWVSATKDKTWRILFNEKSSKNELLGSLSSALKNETFLTDWTKQSGRLEYLDFRFGQKIFYRFK